MVLCGVIKLLWFYEDIVSPKNQRNYFLMLDLCMSFLKIWISCLLQKQTKIEHPNKCLAFINLSGFQLYANVWHSITQTTNSNIFPDITLIWAGVSKNYQDLQTALSILIPLKTHLKTQCGLWERRFFFV